MRTVRSGCRYCSIIKPIIMHRTITFLFSVLFFSATIYGQNWVDTEDVEFTVFDDGQKVYGQWNEETTTVKALLQNLLMATTGEKTKEISIVEKPYNIKIMEQLHPLAPLDDMAAWDKNECYIVPLFMMKVVDDKGNDLYFLRFRAFEKRDKLSVEKLLKIKIEEEEYKLVWATHYGRNGSHRLRYILGEGIPWKVVALFTGAETDDESLNDLIKLTQYDDGLFFTRLIYFFDEWKEWKKNNFFDDFFIEK